MARQSTVRWLTMTAWTSGYQSRTWGQKAPENNEEACSAVGWLEGGRSVVVDGNLLMKEEAVRDGALLGVVAGSSSLKVLLHPQWEAVVRFISSDGDGVEWGGARR
jgi:hypothetical protein